MSEASYTVNDIKSTSRKLKNCIWEESKMFPERPLCRKSYQWCIWEESKVFPVVFSYIHVKIRCQVLRVSLPGASTKQLSNQWAHGVIASACIYMIASD
jgi:hypothetical protein